MIGIRKGTSHMSRIVLLSISLLFAAAVGLLEAIVVVYIRHILDMVPAPVDLTVDVVRRLPRWLLNVERTREACTIVMLASFSYLAGRSSGERIGVFLWTFGLWDLAYYLSLHALLGWPPSLSTLDCLFLIPGPWIAPVWVPVVAATLMAAGGALLVLRGGVAFRQGA